MLETLWKKGNHLSIPGNENGSTATMKAVWQFLKQWKHKWLYAAAAAAKALQSCPTLPDRIDGSPPGSPVPGILQARTLGWVAISFSNAWKWKVKGKSLRNDFIILLKTVPRNRLKIVYGSKYKDDAMKFLRKIQAGHGLTSIAASSYGIHHLEGKQIQNQKPGSN